jgi:CheY-like chemotaxis protein
MTGPIIYIDDDDDDREMIRLVIGSLPIDYKLHLFSNGQDALLYLQNTTDRPLLILCDVNMPVMSGIELRRRINEEEHLRKIATPFVFYSTSINSQITDFIHNYKDQGFYEKAITFSGIQDQIRSMIEYWESRHSPNSNLK